MNLAIVSYEEAIEKITDKTGLGVTKPKTGESFGGLLWHNDEVVSVTTVHINNGWCTLRTLFTPEEHRGNGYAKQLTEWIIADIKHHHPEVKKFRTYSNESSRKLYKSLGFTFKSEETVRGRAPLGILQ